jgi:hypothetical protein
MEREREREREEERKRGRERERSYGETSARFKNQLDFMLEA